ncbi:MAG: hypothetical protein IPP72_16340 [Chitinophagaceae bacterium]|nr:hypothetical protein [Chitinophagaceae bacterium]
MKRIVTGMICWIAVSMPFNPVLSQSVGVNADGSAPHSSAMLDVKYRPGFWLRGCQRCSELVLQHRLQDCWYLIQTLLLTGISMDRPG